MPLRAAQRAARRRERSGSQGPRGGGGRAGRRLRLAGVLFPARRWTHLPVRAKAGRGARAGGRAGCYVQPGTPPAAPWQGGGGPGVALLPLATRPSPPSAHGSPTRAHASYPLDAHDSWSVTGTRRAQAGAAAGGTGPAGRCLPLPKRHCWTVGRTRHAGRGHGGPLV